MRKVLLTTLVLLLGVINLFATDVKLELKVYDDTFYSDEEFNASLDISNINILTAPEVNVVLTIKDINDEEVYTETKKITDLEPDETNKVDFKLDWNYGWGAYNLEFDAQFKDEILPENNKASASINVKVGRTDAIDLMISYGGEMTGDPLFKVGLCYLPMTPYMIGTEFIEEDGDFSYTSESELWGGYIETDKYQMFDKSGYYIFVNTENGEVTSEEIESTPVTVPSSLILSENNVVAGTQVNNITYDWVSNYISKQRQGSVVDPRTCVLMVTGFKERSDAEESGFRNIANRFKDELSKEDLGPGLAASSFDLQEQITGPELIEHIRKMRLKYDKIYFFYSGHGTRNNKLKTGNTPSDYISYDDLMKELYDTKAEDLCVVIEACYSGQAITAAQKNPDWKDRNIQVFTSSDALSTSNIFQDAVNSQYIGLYSTLFFEGFGNAAADANKDGKTTLKEAHDWVLAQDGKFINENNVTIALNSSQNPQSGINVDSGDSELEKLAELFNLAIQETYDEKDTKDAVGRIRKQPSEKTEEVKPDKPSKKLSPEDDVEPVVLEEGEYFGWLDLNKYAKYGHKTAYVVMDLELNSWELYEYDWYPEIVGDDTYDPFDNTAIVFGSDIEEPLERTIENVHEEAEPTKKDSVCALIVSGSDDESQRMENSFKLDCEMVENNLKNESLGPGLDAGSIRNEHKPGFEKLDQILTDMKNNYKKVYFYYSGHGTESGWLGIGDSAWMSQKYLLESLMEINAEEYCIIMDCCFSGKAKDLLDSINIPDGAKVELITASSADRVSFTNYHDTGNDKIGYGFFTLNFLKCFGFPDADTDKDGKTSLTESYNWVKNVNPTDTRGRRLDSLMRPTHTIIRKPKATPEEPVVRDEEAGVELEFTEIKAEMEIDLKVDLSNHNYGLNLNDKILYVSPEDSTSKIYYLDYSGNIDFNVNIKFDYVDYLHNLPTENSDEQRGVIWREGENDEWKPHYPSVFNSNNNTITALDVNHFSQWSLALVDKVSSVDELNSITNQIAYPNPFKSALNIEFNILEAGKYQITMIDMTGRVIDKYDNIYLDSGNNKLLLDGGELIPGSYLVRITKGDSTKVIPVIKQ